MDNWLQTLTPRQHVTLALAGILVIGLFASVLVLLANCSVWQAALAGLAAISIILLVCIVRIGIRVARMLCS
jgi:hypothetical protein